MSEMLAFGDGASGVLATLPTVKILENSVFVSAFPAVSFAKTLVRLYVPFRMIFESVILYVVVLMVLFVPAPPLPPPSPAGLVPFHAMRL